MKKLALFVDIQNIYYTTRQVYGKPFDYRKFWQHINHQGEIVLANAYAIKRQHDDQQTRFQDALKHIGFNVKLKPFIQRSDGTAKGDWDVGITIDVMNVAASVDEVVLLSGDGDFDLLLKAIRSSHNTKSSVYGVTQLTAKSLMDSADFFHPIEDHHLISK